MASCNTLRELSPLIHDRIEQWRGFKKCSRCILPEPFRDISFNGDGVCKHCTNYLDLVERVQEGQREGELLDIIDRFTDRDGADYDAIVCHSGGKDSTYLLDLFKNTYGLRVLAVTMCLGVNSPTAKENIAMSTRQLGVDHLWLDRDPWMMDLYRWGFMAHSDKGLECDVCDLCDEHTRRRILQVAIRKNIPMVIHGADHFQLVDAGLDRGSALLFNRDACWPAVARSCNVFREYYKLPILEQIKRPPLELYPFLYLPYNEEEVCEIVTDKGLVVEADPDETNCDFSYLINILEFLRHGYPAYIHNTSAAILQGDLSVEDAQEEIIEWMEEYAEGTHDEQVFSALPQLGLTMEQLIDPGPVHPCAAESLRGMPIP